MCVCEREFVGLGKVGSKGDGSGGSWQDRKMNEERGDEFSKRERERRGPKMAAREEGVVKSPLQPEFLDGRDYS